MTHEGVMCILVNGMGIAILEGNLQGVNGLGIVIEWILVMGI